MARSVPLRFMCVAFLSVLPAFAHGGEGRFTPFKPTPQQLADGQTAAINYANSMAISGATADPCIVANLMAGDNMRGDGLAAAGVAPCVSGSQGGVVSAVANDEVFIIGGYKYVAKTYCFDVRVGDKVLFVGGSTTTCLDNTFVNGRTERSCAVRCE